MTEKKQSEKVFEFSEGEKVTPEKNSKSAQSQLQEQLQKIADDSDILDDTKHVVHEPSGLTVNEVESALWDSEIGLARLFTKMFKNKLCFNTSAGRWFVYEESCWCLDQRKKHIDACRELHSLVIHVKDKYLPVYKKKAEKFIMQVINSMTTINKMSSVLSQSASGEEGLGVIGEAFDSVLLKIGAPNGIVDLETGELLPDDPGLYMTKQTGCKYDPDAPIPQHFIQFLKETFKYPLERGKLDMSDEEFEKVCIEQCEKLIDYIQSLFGYALLGTCREHLFVCCWGIGRNGKGVLLRTIIRAMGDYAGEIQPSILLDSKNTSSNSPTPAIGDLKGMRLAVASETNQGQFFDTSSVKRLTGGDTLVFRAPYGKDFVRFKPSHTLILQTNFRPNAPAEDTGFWDRTQVIPFLRRFVEEPEPGNIYQAKIDRDLEKTLNGELPGILRWLVEGNRKYRENGLNPPKCIRDAVDQYRSSGDFIADFIDECCNTGLEHRVRTIVFTEALNEWRKVQGYKRPISGPVITERLENKGYIKGKSSFMCYKGLDLNMDGLEYLKDDHKGKAINVAPSSYEVAVKTFCHNENNHDDDNFA